MTEKEKEAIDLLLDTCKDLIERTTLMEKAIIILINKVDKLERERR